VITIPPETVTVILAELFAVVSLGTMVGMILASTFLKWIRTPRRKKHGIPRP
jgi:hypothetical protein